MNKYIFLLLTYTIAHCSDNDFSSLPRALLEKIIKEDEEISIHEFTDKIHKFQSLQKNYEYSLEDLLEVADKEKETIAQFIPLFTPFFKTIISLSNVNKAFHNKISIFYLDPIKSLSHYMKDDINNSLRIGKELIVEGSCGVTELLKSAEKLYYYLNNRTLIKLAGSVDVNNSILEEYLPAALLIPDYTTKCIVKQHAGVFEFTYYALVLYHLLQIGLQRTSNNIVLSTSEQMNIYPGLIHEYLDISVRFLEKKNDLYYYIINKRPNVGFFIKKDSNQGCVIS